MMTKKNWNTISRKENIYVIVYEWTDDDDMIIELWVFIDESLFQCFYYVEKIMRWFSVDDGDKYKRDDGEYKRWWWV